MADHNTTESVPRRNILKTASGLLAGSTMLAGLGAGRGTAETEEGFRLKVEELTEEVIVVNVASVDTFPEADYSKFFLGHADQFEIHDDAVSLPEDTDGLARPVEAERLNEQTYRMYFHTQDSKVADFIGQDYIDIGLGVFPEHTIPRQYWDAEPIPFPCC